MADYPPFMNAYGSIPKILTKIQEAKTPERFTQDFLGTKLGFPGGSPKAFVPLAKRIGLLASDGSPTDLYKRFRNPASSKSAMAEAIRSGYSDLYARNEYAHNLEKTKLQGLVMEATGLEKGSPTLRAICGTFEALKAFADFEVTEPSVQKRADRKDKKEPPPPPPALTPEVEEIGLNIAYTFNLVLPKTDDIAVFNAIFKSLRDNLLRK